MILLSENQYIVFCGSSITFFLLGLTYFKITVDEVENDAMVLKLFNRSEN